MTVSARELASFVGKPADTVSRWATRGLRHRLDDVDFAAHLDKLEALQRERETAERASGRKKRGRKPKGGDLSSAKPDDKTQRNFTDPDSRIMNDGASKAFEQAYNTQIVVDSHTQVIVATAVTQEANDKRQLVPILQCVNENLGRLPEKLPADTGYFSETAVTAEAIKDVDIYVVCRPRFPWTRN